MSILSRIRTGHFRSRILAAAVFIAVGFSSLRAQPAEHVVLITIDGFPARMFWDARISLPHLRELAARGVAAEGMRVSSPSVTWPNHTTLVTGVHPARHSVLFNGILARSNPNQPVSIDPKRDMKDLVAVPTLFDRLHQSGLRTAAIDWPCTRGSAALDDDFPDTPDSLLHTTPRLRRELVAAGILPDETDASFRALSGSARDEVWTRAACHVIAQRKPNLLLLHLLNTDGIHHRYGPGSSASVTALALADRFVGQVLEALEVSGLLARTAVVVTSDHGFAEVSKTVYPNVALRQAGWIELGASNRVTRARVQVISEGGLGMVYLNHPATREEDRRRVIELFSGREGIADIVLPDRFAEFGLPSPEKNQGMADLVLAARDGYGFSADATGEQWVAPVTLESNLGYHGYLAREPKMNALFVAAGAGIRPGTRIGLIENIDVAPTIARLLGQDLPNPDGQPLTEILAPAQEQRQR